MPLWSKVWVSHVERFPQTCHTPPAPCQRSERHMVRVQGEALSSYTCGKLAEAYRAVAGDDEEMGSSAQEVADKYRMILIT